MKQLSEEELAQLEEFAGLMFNDEDLAHLMQLDVTEFKDAMLAQRPPIFPAVKRGRLLVEARNRKAIVEMAERGSTPAQEQLMTMINRMKGDNL